MLNNSKDKEGKKKRKREKQKAKSKKKKKTNTKIFREHEAQIINNTLKCVTPN